MDGSWRVEGFTELRELGAGAQGRVVLAQPATAGGGAVAIKYLARGAGDEEAIERLRAEAAMLARVTDPHVVRLYDFVTSEHGAAMVMEAVDGVSLKTLLDRHRLMPVEAALVVLKGSLLGLAAAHAVGVVHRDYKPANVVVRADGLSKLIDFGVAALSGVGSRSGTPSYMAPEQWEGAPATPAADVYAATCVFFECVVGQKPYTADGQMALMQRHLLSPVPIEAVPEPLRGLVGRGMAKDAAERPPGASAFIAELEESASAAYGPDWEQRGIRTLAAGAVALAAMFPLAASILPSAGAAGAAGAGSTAGGSTAGTGLLSGAGAKVAVAVASTAAVAAAGTGVYVVAASEDKRPPAAQNLSVTSPVFTQTYPVSGGRPAFQVQGMPYVQVSGYSDRALQDRVNTALRAPLDRVVAGSRRALETTPSYGRPTPGCPGAHLKGKTFRGLTGPKLVSVRYEFSMGLICASEYLHAGASVTVDLKTGRSLLAADMLSPAGMSGLSARLPARRPAEGLCTTLPAKVAPADLSPGQGGGVKVLVTPTGTGLEVAPGDDFPCDGSVATVPYAKVRDLLKPEFAALLPG